MRSLRGNCESVDISDISGTPMPLYFRDLPCGLGVPQRSSGTHPPLIDQSFGLRSRTKYATRQGPIRPYFAFRARPALRAPYRPGPMLHRGGILQVKAPIRVQNMFKKFYISIYWRIGRLSFISRPCFSGIYVCIHTLCDCRNNDLYLADCWVS